MLRENIIEQQIGLLRHSSRETYLSHCLCKSVNEFAKSCNCANRVHCVTTAKNDPNDTLLCIWHKTVQTLCCNVAVPVFPASCSALVRDHTRTAHNMQRNCLQYSSVDLHICHMRSVSGWPSREFSACSLYCSCSYLLFVCIFVSSKKTCLRHRRAPSPTAKEHRITWAVRRRCPEVESTMIAIRTLSVSLRTANLCTQNNVGRERQQKRAWLRFALQRRGVLAYVLGSVMATCMYRMDWLVCLVFVIRVQNMRWKHFVVCGCFAIRHAMAFEFRLNALLSMTMVLFNVVFYMCRTISRPFVCVYVYI